MTFVNPIDQRRALASVCIIYTLLTTGYVPTDEDLSISLGHSNFSFLIRAPTRPQSDTCLSSYLRMAQHIKWLIISQTRTVKLINMWLKLNLNSTLFWPFQNLANYYLTMGIKYVYSYLKPMDKRSFFPHLATNDLQGRLTGFSCNATNWCGCWRQYCCAVEEPVPSENNDGSAWFARRCFCSFSIAVPRQGASAPQTAFPFDIINGDDDVADDGLFDGGNSSSNNWRSPVRRLQCSSQQAAMR